MGILRANFLFAILIITGIGLLLPILAIMTTAGSGPPTSYLRYGEREQTGQVGAYCWIERRRLWFDGGRCVDTSSLRVPVDVLTVQEGTVLTLDLGGKTKPSELRVRAIPVTITPNPPVGQQWHMIRVYEGYTLPYTLEGTNAEITMDLRPGEYAIEVILRVPTGFFVNPSGQRIPTSNSVSYGFHLVIAAIAPTR